MVVPVYVLHFRAVFVEVGGELLLSLLRHWVDLPLLLFVVPRVFLEDAMDNLRIRGDHSHAFSTSM